MRHGIPIWLWVVAGCSNAAANESKVWVRAAQDTNYAISIDTSRIETPEHRQWVVVWYRTDHAQPRLHKGQPFDRELVKTLLRCNDLSFKIQRVDMSSRAGHVIAGQRASTDEIAKQPWRNVERGTIEETVARQACELARLRPAMRRR
jgi:hypothetical protein